MPSIWRRWPGELLIVNLPMTVLCKEGCLGLCGQCGQDRNVTDCGHSQAQVELPTTQRLPLGELGKTKEKHS